MTLTDIISKVTRYAKKIIVTDNSSTDAVRITQTGSGNALVVEDSSNPDSSPFVVTANGDVGVGTLTPTHKFHVIGGTKVLSKFETDQTEGYIQIIPINDGTKRVEFAVRDSGDYGALWADGDHIVWTRTGRVGIKIIPQRDFHVLGQIRFQGLPVYANNAAAIAGGLAADDVYKTATGEVRIVV
jgi:hypothetical protein